MEEDEELDGIQSSLRKGKGLDMRLIGAALAILALVAVAYVLLFMGNEVFPPPENYTCADGTQVAAVSDCPEFTKYICPDGSIVNREDECQLACGMEAVKTSLRAKMHPDDPVFQSASSSAMSAFNASQDDEALFYKEQLYQNIQAGKITEAEYRHLELAIALHRFVRDSVALLPQPVDFSTTRDDITVFESRAGRRDEKALLYRSMLTANGIGSKIVVYANCGASSPCECLQNPQHVFVAMDIPAYARMQFYPSARYPGSPATCAVSSGMVVVDAAGGYFGYGLNCTGKSFFTVLD